MYLLVPTEILHLIEQNKNASRCAIAHMEAFRFHQHRCSDENSGAWRLTEGGFRQMRTAGVVLVEDAGNQWRRLDLVHGWPPQRRGNAA